MLKKVSKIPKVNNIHESMFSIAASFILPSFLSILTLPVRDIFQHLSQQPFSIFNHSFLMARRTKSPTLARKCQQILVAAFFTTDPGKSHMKITAAKISINHSHDVGPPETVPGCIHIIPGPLKFFKMIFAHL